MRKYQFIAAIVLIIAIFIVPFALINHSNKVSITQESNIILVFKHNDIVIEKELIDEERKQLINIINNRKYISKFFMGELSCGFSENIALLINDEMYEIACDNCPYILVKSKDKYLEFNDNEKKIIEDIFEKYGGYFPCV